MNKELFLHDFSLDWQMNTISKEELCREFRSSEYSFTEFKSKLLERNLWVSSMETLKEYELESKKDF